LLHHQSSVDVQNQSLVIILVNPLHHVNSSCVLYWALNMFFKESCDDIKDEVELVVFQKYNKDCFSKICEMIELGSSSKRYVLPLTPKHITFLYQDQSDTRNRIGKLIQSKRLKVLLGSAEVSKETYDMFRSIQSDKDNDSNVLPPSVRFGSTETSLQCVYITDEANNDDLWQWGFERGLCFIGQSPSDMVTDKLLALLKYWKVPSPTIAAISNGKEEGPLIVKGPSVIAGYTNKKLSLDDDGWYDGLGDICIRRVTDKGIFLYWKARSVNVLKRGGVK